MFRETIHHSSGVIEGAANEQHATMLLTSAVRRGYDVEFTPAGGALITWTRHLFGAGGNSAVRADRSISLEPFTPVGALSDTARDDLALIAGDRHARYDEQDGRRVIRGLVWQIPAFTTARLRARGLVVEDGDRLRLSLTARLGLLAQAHRTSTTAPNGWYRPSAADPYGSAGLNRPGGRAGMLRDSGSAATCACGELSGWGGDRDEARRLTRDHRRAVAAAFIAEHLAYVPAPAAARCDCGGCAECMTG
ncbi:hypothetical protein J7E96_19265 [Streptomyces sp. ISL-96]|uniref:hypothetical protein n=1 Tax=Streptomyces sp. ISL-96 TaxID=2819191 RepID=UPI001BE8ABCE|nr:hypothetical protein [Streptomyces sp. ISL-96]MBT2490614.1 hypothetical protein [Streptomyces sp. ISL-96]